MGRSHGFFARLPRVLELCEKILEDFTRQACDARDLQLFARHEAFRWDARRGLGRLVPIQEPDRFDLYDLTGVEQSVERLIENAEQFVRGYPCNHVLLYGERGTGKSSAVKGLLVKYGNRGLRMVEVHKSDLIHLPSILAALRGAPYRFVLFCDDLSFDAGESDYRELKAVLEGSLVAPPENVKIFATSNRRHLLPETRSDNRAVRLDENGEVRLGEAIDEKLALSDRFGLVLGFFGFDQETYLSIVSHYAKQAGVCAPSEKLRAEALRWALSRSSRSGRTAKQFVDDFVGREAIRKA